MRLQVDENRCISAGQCVLAAPDVFDQRESDGVVELLEAHPPRQSWESSRTAAALCPASAIAVRES
ncbi:ferredoxin [Actinoplanes rectilineatus]|uniref:ferredoxin n=1 Tax=Actinoplanes rectilineatus TaxID=113571 RepID=UPI0005F2944B|nr:ferredoxin [Actinoplanes rectilineatus]